MFFGRDAQIVRGLEVLRGMRTSGVKSLFVILGPSGAGKSSFLRAGLRDRPHRRYSRSVFELRRHSEILRLTESAALVAACPTPSMMPPSPSRMPRISGSSDWSKPSL